MGEPTRFERMRPGVLIVVGVVFVVTAILDLVWIDLPWSESGTNTAALGFLTGGIVVTVAGLLLARGEDGSEG